MGDNVGSAVVTQLLMMRQPDQADGKALFRLGQLG
jgi:hypothetical protein